MFDRRSPWDRQHDGRSAQQPGKCYLRWTGIVRSRDPVQHLAGDFTGSQWEPGNKSNFIALTIIHHVVPFTIGEAVAVLHRDDRDNFASSLDVLLRNVGQSDQANLPFVSQLSQRLHGCFKRHDGIRNMQLINVDPLQTQSLEASLNCLAKVCRSCIVGPLVRAGTIPASFGGDYKTSRVRKQSFGNQFLAYLWAVGICRIDQIDIKLCGPAKNR